MRGQGTSRLNRLGTGLQIGRPRHPQLLLKNGSENMCVCVRVWEREGERERESNREKISERAWGNALCCAVTRKTGTATTSCCR